VLFASSLIACVPGTEGFSPRECIMKADCLSPLTKKHRCRAEQVICFQIGIAILDLDPLSEARNKETY
jgi:hypothetical protein